MDADHVRISEIKDRSGVMHEVQPEGNYYDKYNTNNIIEKRIMNNFFKKCQLVLNEIKPDTKMILEAGCGEGSFTHFIYEQFGKQATIEAFDISAKCIKKAKRQCPKVKFATGSVYEMRQNGVYDLVVASEVLEHMDNPECAIDALVRASSRYIFITVPNEPLWRILNMARGKYWKRLGNTPGHIQHWNKKTIAKIVEGGVDPK